MHSGGRFVKQSSRPGVYLNIFGRFVSGIVCVKLKYYTCKKLHDLKVEAVIDYRGKKIDNVLFQKLIKS